MDDVLPWPEPTWDQPQHYDGPTPEEVEALRRLKSGGDGLLMWVAGAVTIGITPQAWTELAERLTRLADMCTALGENP
jgi:hypothetical protein